MTRLIITNGGSAAKRLRAAGLEDELLLWRDVLHDGPVPRKETLEQLSETRARFIAADLGRAGGLNVEDVRRDFSERDALFRRSGEFDRIEIWLEHDLYDQLQLVQILSEFSKTPRDGVFLVQAEDYLGDQTPEAIRGLAETAAPVTREQLTLGARAWRAFTSETPEALVGLLGEDLTALPHLRAAILRLLAEYPDPIGGLSLTEHRMLMSLYWGPASPSDLFRRVSEAEDARFMGDISFFRRLDTLAFAPTPLVHGLDEPFTFGNGGADGYSGSRLNLSEPGCAAIDGRFDHAEKNLRESWIGGTQLTPDGLWRWDREALKLIPPI